ncbi:unnamed protein product [Rotaria sp. Silwood1]|nr:unnamed protein product [Rotaria sp. Silwood1]
MNESLSSTTMEQSDSRYFSQRAKHISLLREQSPSVFVKPPLSETHFQFSNRSHMSITDTQLTAVGRGHGNLISNDHRQIISTGRGRTTIPLSSFILQKDNLSPSPSTAPTISSPIFVMHEEVQFVRPYFGPPSTNDIQSSSTSHKRDILLSALKEIESGLKTL